MKRIFLLFTSMLIVFNLFSCIDNGNAEKYEKYEEYEDLIDYIEDEDFENAYEELKRIANKKANTSPESESLESALPVTVDITMENWQDYFEIVEKTVTNYNEFDEIEDMYLDHYLVLKDEYTLYGYDTSIAVEYDYVLEWRYVEVDKTAGKHTVGDLVPERESEEKKGEMVTVTMASTDLEMSRTWSDGMQAIGTNFNIVRVKGTLCIEG